MQAHLKTFKAAAKAAGLKLTSQRIAIFQELLSRSDHPDAEAIHEALLPRLPALSLDTVYRTLWTLSDLGLIAALAPRGETSRFDGNLGRHHHFVCLGCGKIEDFTSPELDDLRLPGELSRFGRVLDSQVEVRGYCTECSKAPAPAAANIKMASGPEDGGRDG